MVFKSYRAESRADWGVEKEDGFISDEHIKLGALLRIADSLEDIKRHMVRQTNIREQLEKERRKNKRLRDKIKKAAPMNVGGRL